MITIVRGFEETQRESVARIYWAAFEQKLARPLGPARKGCALLMRTLDPSHVFTAEDETGQVAGVAGYKTARGAFVAVTFRDLQAIYGFRGALWRAMLLSLLERKLAPGQMVMDGICVAEHARGAGIGTRLLSAVAEEAQRLGYGQVRLDVIDSNPRARALYERFGFHAEGTEQLGPLRWVFGFRSATEMRLDLEPPAP